MRETICFALARGVLVFIMGSIIALISHHIASVIASEVVLEWDYCYNILKIDFLRWIILEIVGISLLGIGLGIMLYNLKRSIKLRSQRG